jgi:hypothetical protein
MEVFDLDEFKEMLVADGDANEWDDTDSELEVFAT